MSKGRELKIDAEQEICKINSLLKLAQASLSQGIGEEELELLDSFNEVLEIVIPRLEKVEEDLFGANANGKEDPQSHREAKN